MSVIAPPRKQGTRVYKGELTINKTNLTKRCIKVTDISTRQHRKLFINRINKTRFIAFFKNKRKQNKIKRSAWVCTCGCIIPKKGAKLSGGPQYKQDYHVHCTWCGRIVDQFINPKEIQ